MLGFIGLGAAYWGGVGQGVVSNRPELHPLSLTVTPASPVKLGESVTLKVGVENRSQRAVTDSGRFSLGFYYRTFGDSQWERLPEDVTFGTGLKSTEVKNASIQFSTLTLKNLPKEKTEFVVELRVLVDYKNEVDEQDERNNQIATAVTLRVTTTVGKPDLSPVDIRFDCLPASVTPCPAAGISQDIQAIQIMATIANLSDSVFEGTLNTTFSICRANTATKPPSCISTAQAFPALESGKDVVTLEPQASQTCKERGQQAGLCAARRTLLFPPSGDLLRGGKLSVTPGTYRVEVQIGTNIEEVDKGNNILVSFFTIPGPELRPTGIRFEPSIIRERGILTVYVTVKNEGRVNQEGRFKVRFTVNQHEFSETGDILELPEGLTGLNAGAEQIFKATLFADRFKLQRNQSALIQAQVDPDNTVSEQDESNNTIESKLTVLESAPMLAELRPKALLLNPLSPVEKETLTQTTFVQPGKTQTVRITAKIINTGEASVENVRVCFSYRNSTAVVWTTKDRDNQKEIVSSPHCPTSGTSPLKLERLMKPESDGIDATADLIVENLPPGSYEVRAVVNPVVLDRDSKEGPAAHIPELDLFNNEIVTHMLLLAPIKPDLEVSFRLSPTLGVNFGTPFTFSATITNNGDDVVDKPFKVQFNALHAENIVTPERKQVIGTITVPASKERPLAPGQTRELTITVATGDIPPVTPGVPFINRPGIYILEVTVDPDNEIEEQKETNNTAANLPDPLNPASAFKINGPDLTLDRNGFCVQMTSEGFCNERLQFVTGESFLVSANIFNRGSQIARSYNVEIRLCRGQLQCKDSELITSNTVPMAPLENGNRVRTRPVEFNTKGLPPGRYQLNTVIDPASPSKPFGEVLEELETDNNTGVLNIQIGEQPDLVMKKLFFDVKAPVVGPQSVVTVVADVGNEGKGSPLQPVPVQFAIRSADQQNEPRDWKVFDVKIAIPTDTDVFFIDPGRQGKAQGILKVADLRLAAGRYLVRATANPENKIPELDGDRPVTTRNNSLTIEIEIQIGADSGGGSWGPGGTPPSGPCPVPGFQGIDLRIGSLGFNPSTASIPQDGRVRVQAIVDNAGLRPSGSFQVQFGYRRANTLQPSTQFALQTFESLTSCQNANVQADFDNFLLALEPGEYELVVTVDPFNFVREEDKSNNQAFRTLTIRR
jgi:hypothetical protein